MLYGRDEFCESSRMLDQGAARGAMPPRVMPSAAMVYAGCGITLAKVTEADSGTAERYFARAEDLLTKAAADPAVSQRTSSPPGPATTTAAASTRKPG